MIINLISKTVGAFLLARFFMDVQILACDSRAGSVGTQHVIDTVAEYCMRFQQKKCLNTSIKPGLKVFGHLNEIFVTEDGCVDDDLISEYMKIQKKNSFKKDLSDHFIESDESRKGIGGRSTSLKERIRLGISSESFFCFTGQSRSERLEGAYHRCSNGGCRGWFPPDNVYFAPFKVIGQMLRSD